MTPTVTQGHCQQQHLLNPTEQRFGESSQTKEEYPADGTHA